MDLVAYGNIENLTRLAEANGIDVERLRGYRLMRDEEPYSQDELAEALEGQVGTYWWMACDECDPDWFDHPCEMYTKGYRPPSIPKGERVCIWAHPDNIDDMTIERIRTISFFQEIGMLKARFKRQYEMWNKYAGRDDVLYIHARLGGYNWKGFYDDDERAEHEIHDGYWIERQPWFLEKCDDSFDPTYCDIYAKIDKETIG